MDVELPPLLQGGQVLQGLQSFTGLGTTALLCSAVVPIVADEQPAALG